MSRQKASTDQLPLFPADHPVNQPVLPGSEEAEQMTVGSGRSLLASLNAFYRPGSWQKTLLESLILKTRWRSRNGLLAWKIKTIRFSHRLCIQLRHSVPITADTESSLLPTLTASYRRGNKSASPGATYRPSLPEIAKLLPTLTARDCRTYKGAKTLPGHIGAEPLTIASGGTLDPAFCGWYMGFEDGWTDVESKHSETRAVRSRSTRSCGP